MTHRLLLLTPSSCTLGDDALSETGRAWFPSFLTPAPNVRGVEGGGLEGGAVEGGEAQETDFEVKAESLGEAGGIRAGGRVCGEVPSRGEAGGRLGSGVGGGSEEGQGASAPGEEGRARLGGASGSGTLPVPVVGGNEAFSGIGGLTCSRRGGLGGGRPVVGDADGGSVTGAHVRGSAGSAVAA